MNEPKVLSPYYDNIQLYTSNLKINYDDFIVYTGKPMIKVATQVKKKMVSNKTKLSQIFKYKPLSKYVGITGNIPVRAGTTFVGVEIELEKIKYNNNILGVWASTEDGSLKENGMEFVSIPIPVKYLEVELSRLFTGLKHFNASSRCSTHIHLNVRDFTLDELKTFICLYLIFEKSLYNYSGNRYENNYCVPLAYNLDMVRNLVDYIDTYENMVDHGQHWYKYCGFNLSPIYGGESTKIGTIEFRHMKGTGDISYIINWINLIVSLKITAKKFKYQDIIDMVKHMNTTSAYFWLAGETFKDFKSLIISQRNFKYDAEEGISNAKSVFLAKGAEKIIEEVIKINFNKKGK